MADRYLRLVSRLIAQMTGANEFSAAQLYGRALALVAEQFEAECASLRHHNRTLRVSTLIAEWPVCDPVRPVGTPFAEHAIELTGDLLAPAVAAADPSGPAVAVAPLRWGNVTTGVISATKPVGAHWTDEELEALGVVGSLFAQTQARIAAESRLRRLAERDDLTGLYNRRALITELGRRLRIGRPGPVAVLYVDLDRLKSINDHLGHAAGDEVIRACARRLMSDAGRGAVVARVGGDEFVVIPDRAMSDDAAESLARRLQQAVCRPVQAGGLPITRTVSIGVAVGMPGEDSGNELLSRADQAALTVKRDGGNGIAVCDREAVSAHNVTELPIARAMELQYLPEVDLRSGDIVAVEALVNWPSAASGAAFSAVRSDLLVLRRACGDLSRWRSHGVAQSVTMCLHVSPAQLAAGSFVDSVSSVLDEFGIDPASIRVEVREDVVSAHLRDARITLAALKDIGVRVAIDAYGHGEVALLQLKTLPVDLLKIDSGFTRGLGHSAEDLTVVRTVIGLAGSVGVQLAARGVETTVAATTVLRHGCTQAQGLLWGRPVCSDVMESLLSRGRLALPRLAADQAGVQFVPATPAPVSA